MAICPRPPPPIAPDIALYPKIVPQEMVAPTISEVLASGISTLKMIVGMFAPIDCAASITPGSTSSREDSIMRATYGAAAMTRGTIVAVEP